MSATASTCAKPAEPSSLLLPPEIIHRISYRSTYPTARKLRSTAFWLRQWCKEADLPQYLLGARRTWIWAAHGSGGRVGKDRCGGSGG
ncbi:hypothetical protein HK097_007699 [Rhizophlyctis rosea]|uniref:Uncharacterized protein n=1 Tax=Rhizophlyctis rosea TaxID=64517 RepID=A0AAD5SJA8_9FUNG|nr:hypothetical protein HK097_007699 [Rhizophlyctis rosea]